MTWTWEHTLVWIVAWVMGAFIYQVIAFQRILRWWKNEKAKEKQAAVLVQVPWAASRKEAREFVTTCMWLGYRALHAELCPRCAVLMGLESGEGLGSGGRTE